MSRNPRDFSLHILDKTEYLIVTSQGITTDDRYIFCNKSRTTKPKND